MLLYEHASHLLLEGGVFFVFLLFFFFIIKGGIVYNKHFWNIEQNIGQAFLGHFHQVTIYFILLFECSLAF